MWGCLRGSTEHTNTFLGQKVKKVITFSWKVTGHRDQQGGMEQPGAFGHVSVLKWLIYTASTKALSGKHHLLMVATQEWKEHWNLIFRASLPCYKRPNIFPFWLKIQLLSGKKKWGNKNRQLFFPVICCRITWGELQSELVSESVTSER